MPQLLCLFCKTTQTLNGCSRDINNVTLGLRTMKCLRHFRKDSFFVSLVIVRTHTWICLRSTKYHVGKYVYLGSITVVAVSVYLLLRKLILGGGHRSGGWLAMRTALLLPRSFMPGWWQWHVWEHWNLMIWQSARYKYKLQNTKCLALYYRR